MKIGNYELSMQFSYKILKFNRETARNAYINACYRHGEIRLGCGFFKIKFTFFKNTGREDTKFVYIYLVVQYPGEVFRDPD